MPSEEQVKKSGEHQFEKRELKYDEDGNLISLVKNGNIAVTSEPTENPYVFKREARVKQAFKEGEVIETGLLRVLPEETLGADRYMEKENLDTDTALWRTPDFEGEQMWCSISGNSMFMQHKTIEEFQAGEANVVFEYTYDAPEVGEVPNKGYFKMIALRDLEAGEVLSAFRATRTSEALPEYLTKYDIFVKPEEVVEAASELEDADNSSVASAAEQKAVLADKPREVTVGRVGETA